MIKQLIKLAEHLDKNGHFKEADYVDWMIKSASSKFHTIKNSLDVSEFEEEIKRVSKSKRMVFFNKFNLYPESIKIAFIPRKMSGKIHALKAYVDYTPMKGLKTEEISKKIRDEIYDPEGPSEIKKALNNAGRKLAKELGASVSEAVASNTGVMIYFKEPIMDSME